MDDNDKIIRLSEVLRMKAYGGDEFVVVFPESDADNDFAVGDTERLLERAAQIQDIEIILKGRGQPNFVSVGTNRSPEAFRLVRSSNFAGDAEQIVGRERR